MSDDAYHEVKMAVTPILSKMGSIKEKIIYKNLEIHSGKKITRINLSIVPLTHIDVLRGLILVIFEDIKANEFSHHPSSIKQVDHKFDQVVQELKYTKENLHATIEELEAGNEELQSANEELQSTNEEIETSKEELQSLNEELIIVNTELQSMIDKLATVNDDMNNLFNSTEIAAFFLDNDMLIKRFTPKAQEFMHLIQTDVGRSFSHFSSTLKCEKLIEHAEEVLKTLRQKNYDVQSKDDRWYHIRILPYRTLSNMIDGVVITLNDITTFKEYENKLLLLNHALQDSLAYSENILNTVREPFLVLSKELKIISANLSFYKIFKLNETDTIDKFIYEISNNQLDIPQLRRMLKKVISKNQVFESFPISYTHPKIGNRKFLLTARKIHRVSSDVDLILLTLGLQ